MNQQLKQRLVGAAVLVILAVIFLPMILKRPAPTQPDVEVQDINLVPYQEQPEQKSPSTIPPEVIARYEADEYGADITDSVTSLDELVEKLEANAPAESPKSVPVQNKEQQKPQPLVNAAKPKPVENANAKFQWVIQLGSFSNKENADRMVKRLKQQNYKAYRESVQSAGKAIFRVRIGPLATKGHAEQIKQKVDLQENLKTLILKYD